MHVKVMLLGLMAKLLLMTKRALGRVSSSGTPHSWCKSCYGAPQTNRGMGSGFNDTRWCACLSIMMALTVDINIHVSAHCGSPSQVKANE